MKQHALAALLVLVPAVGWIRAIPASSRPGTETRIGVVDLDDLVTNSPAGIRAGQSFELSRKTKQDALDQRQAGLKKDVAELEKQKAALAPEEYEKRRKQFEQAFLEVQQTYVKLERELAENRQTLVSNLMLQAKPELLKLAQSEGLSVIVEKSATLWVDPALDLTQRVKAELK